MCKYRSFINCLYIYGKKSFIMDIIKKHSRRVRRTDATLNNDIFNAVSTVVTDIGFAKLTLKDICDRANLSANVIYNRYDSIEGLLEAYVEKHDYWISHFADLSYNEGTSFEEFYISSAKELINEIYENKEFRAFLAWDLIDDNVITRQLAEKREVVSDRLTEFIDNFYIDPEIDVEATTAIFIAGIYYLLLRKERSPFCKVDLATEEGKARLISAIEHMIKKTFTGQDNIKAMRSLAEDGVDQSVICKAFAITPEQLSVYLKTKN